MSSYWSYRVVKRLDGFYALHEVYFNAEGVAVGMTEDPIWFFGDTPEDVLWSLKKALGDAKKAPFEEPKKWPGGP